jgi:hypothetical protein
VPDIGFTINGNVSVTPFVQAVIRNVNVFIDLNSIFRIVTLSLPSGVVGQPYTANVSAAGGVPSYVWSVIAGALPPGLALTQGTPTAVISGTPTAVGTFPVTIQATDAFGAVDADPFSIQILSSGPGSGALLVVEPASASTFGYTLVRLASDFVFEPSTPVSFAGQYNGWTPTGVTRVEDDGVVLDSGLTLGGEATLSAPGTYEHFDATLEVEGDAVEFVCVVGSSTIRAYSASRTRAPGFDSARQLRIQRSANFVHVFVDGDLVVSTSSFIEGPAVIFARVRNEGQRMQGKVKRFELRAGAMLDGAPLTVTGARPTALLAELPALAVSQRGEREIRAFGSGGIATNTFDLFAPDGVLIRSGEAV